MKFPTLTRLPNYKRFNFEPRYYDPVKEDIEIRTSRIKQEISQLADDRTNINHRSNISGAFARKTSHTANANILQLVIMIFLITLFGGYLLYGNDIFYIFLLIVPVYFYFRLKKFSKRR